MLSGPGSPAAHASVVAAPMRSQDAVTGTLPAVRRAGREAMRPDVVSLWTSFAT